MNGNTEDNPIYIGIDQLERLEEKYGFCVEYEELKEGKTVFKDGKYLKLSPFSGASKL